MSKKIIITEEQLRFLVAEERGEIVKVWHMAGSDKYKPKKYNSWEEFWKVKRRNSTFPSKGSTCDCCKKVIVGKNDHFVGSHVITKDKNGKTTGVFIYPTCNSCNSKAAKDEKFRGLRFYATSDMLAPVEDGDYELIEENHSK